MKVKSGMEMGGRENHEYDTFQIKSSYHVELAEIVVLQKL